MSMKAIGAVLSVLAFLVGGNVLTRCKEERIRTLWNLEAGLELLQGELELRSAALPELCSSLSGRTEGAAQKLFVNLSVLLSTLGEESFSTIWSRAVIQCCGALSGEEREELLRLGKVLGRFELETQLERLRLCRSSLRRAGEEAEKNYPGERRLYMGLGTAAGALLVIVLL